uniref:Uncharacterized protein n=1 Tax=Siphoviridae sp. ctuUw41 TaxID=2826503 RepID=A0A8S5MXZ0_9CAUD|nr:MAG TPA: hypothetical protein [Siphoviridae sp. ctuUw41]
MLLLLSCIVKVKGCLFKIGFWETRLCCYETARF